MTSSNKSHAADGDLRASDDIAPPVVDEAVAEATDRRQAPVPTHV